MKSTKKILIAFILNLFFSIFEFIGGIFTNSVSIISDSVHDLGDSISIGISYFLEKKSKRIPDEQYTYGYCRYSVVGSIITLTILLVGSVIIIYNSVLRIMSPQPINYDGMIVLGFVGVFINLLAAFFTKDNDSLNQHAVNLHMLEDVASWIIVLLGAIIMKFTNFYMIDSILSILVSSFIFIHAIKGFKVGLDIFLEKTPTGIEIHDIRSNLMKRLTIDDVHHIHVWSIDGYHNYATMHVVTMADNASIKSQIRNLLKEFKIVHVTIELEDINEICEYKECQAPDSNHHNHQHHHH